MIQLPYPIKLISITFIKQLKVFWWNTNFTIALSSHYASPHISLSFTCSNWAWLQSSILGIGHLPRTYQDTRTKRLGKVTFAVIRIIRSDSIYFIPLVN
jgi:O-antigen ligase